MESFQKILYGTFPRAVGTDTTTGQLRQWTVHSEGEFDLFVDTVSGQRNPYASISWRPVGGELRLDKVSFDLDTEQKPDWPVFDGEYLPEDEMIARMRADSSVADAVLGTVLEEAKRIIDRSVEDGIPVISVFSGFGLHIHQLYREKLYPDKQIDTTVKKYVADLNLTTADPQVGGDVKRILRIPNAERIHIETDGTEFIAQRSCDLFNIPLVAEDFEGLTPSRLLELALTPRTPPLPDLSERPAMRTHDEYVSDYREPKKEEQRKLDKSVLGDEDSEVRDLLESFIPMPCMLERIQQPEPDHPVRLNCAVMLFNVGFSPDEVTEIFSRIGWRDWNRAKTRNYLRQIYQRGYSDMSCSSIRQKGLCTRADDARSCPTWGWRNGKAEWKRSV